MRKKNFCLTIATVVVLLMTAFLGGCLFDDSTSSDIDNSLKQELQETFETLYDTLGTPGAIIKIRFPKGAIWQSMIGITEASIFPSGSDVTWEGPLASNPNTHTRVGSITKTFTAMLTLILVDEGFVELDGVIDDYLPNFDVDIPNSDRISVRQLLNMTAGLVSYTNLEEFVQNWPPILYSPQELIQFAVDAGGTNFEPGEGYEYSNTNYIVLALIAEAVTDKTYRELVQEKITEPLGLDETSVPAPTEETIPAPNWHGYSIEMTPDVWEDFFMANMFWAWSAGNIISTRDNLMIWAQAWNQGTLLSDEMKSAQKEWVDMGIEGRWYGCGIAKLAVYDGSELIGYLEGHNGSAPGYETSAWKFNNYYIVAMSNGRHIPGREDIRHTADYICIEMAKVLNRAEQ
jgi:D-alanyl-D-alanine carboxypeptidase